MDEITYLKIKDYNGYDNYYMEILPDKTWQKTLDLIESVLDDKYCNNDDKLNGISLSLEIVTLNAKQYQELGLEEFE